MKKSPPAAQPRRPGRPLSFDREHVLRSAMLQFWKSGYETTSIVDLTNAMGVTAPSLYAAFGDKEALFLESVKLYTSSGAQSTEQQIHDAATSRIAAELLLQASARFFTQSGSPPGCLVASAASTGSEASRRVRTALKKVRSVVIKALEERTQRDIDEGVISPRANAHALASMVVAVIQGMSTLARDGAGRQSLLDIVEAALAAWPI